MKRVLLAALLVVVVAVAALGASVFLPFRALSPAPEKGEELPGRAHLVNDGMALSYVLFTDDGAALVDCGNDPAGAAILAELKEHSLGPENVKAIFLTHGHPDHTAACHLFPNADVYAFAGDVGIAAGTAKSHGPITSLVSGPPEKRIRVTKLLSDGETITLGDRKVVAFAVPGHTAGSAAYLSNGVLFMGDSAGVGRDGVLRTAMPMFSDDRELNRKSLRELARRLQQRGDNVELTAYGHSAPSKGLEALENFAR